MPSALAEHHLIWTRTRRSLVTHSSRAIPFSFSCTCTQQQSTAWTAHLANGERVIAEQHTARASALSVLMITRQTAAGPSWQRRVSDTCWPSRFACVPPNAGQWIIGAYALWRWERQAGITVIRLNSGLTLRTDLPHNICDGRHSYSSTLLYCRHLFETVVGYPLVSDIKLKNG